jgi:1-acyl-sn-glycerol-3-phosphate acyltransferase
MSSKILVVQHNFNGFVSYISKNLWGAWTIDKDDKTPLGKKKLNAELQNIVEYMKKEDDLTVVIYPQGRVPKNTEDCRQVSKIYPGAFYMSLMTKYPITTLINDYSREGVFSMIVKEPVDLYHEYMSRMVDHSDVGSFRNNVRNKELLDEICERFRKVYQEEYDFITKTESWMNK